MIYQSGNPIPAHSSASKFRSFKEVYDITSHRQVKNWLITIAILLVVISFLPWTQNITGHGQLTSLRPDQRPQTIQSVIPGRIEKWFVKEGQFVHRGDTIMFLSETKDDYFDPNLLTNVQDQIRNKEGSVHSYMQKVEALDVQIDALNQNMQLKLQQQEIKIRQGILKVTTDSTDNITVIQNFRVAEEQIERFRKLHQQGLISETELEQREVNVQNARAKVTESENKLMIGRQELINARTEMNTLRAEYADKISKAESEKYASMGSMYDSEAQVTKLQNSFANYKVRNGMYFVTAPQDGYITRALTTGVGETIKEGTEIVSIMPGTYDLAVEMFVNPMDLPLVKQGNKVRFIFDGWPAFVFSGWPGASFGTFGGKVIAIDNFISENGKFRILVGPDTESESWPNGLRVGGGAQGIALLNDVPIWYELWRQFNGFPPDFYVPDSATKEEKK